MTIRRSPRGKWMIDINYSRPDGTVQRIRKVSPVQSRRGAEQHERELRVLLQAGLWNGGDEQEDETEGETKPCSVAEFVEVFLDEHSRTEGLRPRYIQEQRRALEQHVVPVIGEEPIDEVGTKQFGMVKRAMLKKNPDYSPKTVNNTLGVLSKMVRFWWEREGLDAPHFRVGLLKVDEREAEFYEPESYERLVEGAGECGAEELAIVLLMGEAGLRQGELRALQWSDITFSPTPVIRVQRALSLDGDEHSPKGRRNRTVPMSQRLVDALREHKAEQGSSAAYVFVRENNEPLTASAVRARVSRVERQAGIEGSGKSHIMRHTFTTSLSDANVSPRVIQELVGHTELKTTLRYMHTRNEAAHKAIESLEKGRTRAQQEAVPLIESRTQQEFDEAVPLTVGSRAQQEFDEKRGSQRHHSGTAQTP